MDMTWRLFGDALIGFFGRCLDCFTDLTSSWHLLTIADAGQAEALCDAPVSLVCEVDNSLWLQHQVSFKGLAQKMNDE